MKLQPLPFSLIKEGSQTIETRLYDKKRRTITIGDTIVFSRIDDPTQTIKVRVYALSNYKTFSDLFDVFPPKNFGGTNKDDLMKIYRYYSKEKEQRYSVLGIHVQVL